MSAKSEKWKIDNDFYLNKRTKKVKYNDLCVQCKNSCKQSHKAKIIICKNFEKEK